MLVYQWNPEDQDTVVTYYDTYDANLKTKIEFWFGDTLTEGNLIQILGTSVRVLGTVSSSETYWWVTC
jgi:hypothetical protein